MYKLKKHHILPIMLILCLTWILAACSEGNSSKEQTAEPEEAIETEENQSAFPRTVKDANTEVIISEEPKKVAVVHWGLSDTLLTFDLSSIAIALPFTYEQSVLKSEAYKPYVDKLEEMVIIGESETVDLEALLAYEPDVIIAGNQMNNEIADSLNAIAPTVFLDEVENNIWEDWRPVMMKIGEILGQEEQAQNYIDNFEQNVQAAKEKIGTVEGTVAFTQVREKVMWLQSPAYLTKYYDALGLEMPEDKMMAEGGMITLEGLSQLNPDHLFLGFFNYSDPTLAAVTEEWETTQVWKNLSSVQTNQVYSINGELALGYGPIGEAYGIEAIVAALAEE